MNFTNLYFKEIVKIIELIDHNKIERIVDILFRLRIDGGRLFFLGVGGSAGNCSHAVNDR